MLYQRELLRCCLESGTNFDRIFILTGQDYPLWSNARIADELTRHPDKEYIIGLDHTTLPDPVRQRKITHYHFFRDMRHIPFKYSHLLAKAWRGLMVVLPIRKKTYIEMPDGERWHVWQSSAYMCLTADLARHVLRQMTDNKTLMKYFKYAFAPDEMVIPTIIFNSPWRDRCTVYPRPCYEGLQSLSAITYFEYGRAIKMFSLDDYDKLMASGKMFARKFATGTSDTLMEKLSSTMSPTTPPSPEKGRPSDTL